MCWYLCSKQSSALTVPPRAGNDSKRLLEAQSSRGAAWLMLHPLKKLPQSSCTSFFRCGTARGIQADPSCLPWPRQQWQPGSAPCDGFALQDAVEFSISPLLICAVARGYQCPEVCIPFVACPDTALALGALSQQQNAPESNLFAWFIWFLSGFKRLDTSSRILSCMICQWKLAGMDIWVGSRYKAKNRHQDTGLGLWKCFFLKWAETFQWGFIQ